jgi:prepilin-type processing-associated H-X9-DG protein
MKQMGLAVHNYHDTFKALVPSTTQMTQNLGQTDWGWGAALLPYLEQNAVFEILIPGEATWGHPDYNPAVMPALNAVLSVYLCPSSATAPTVNYSGGPCGTDLGYGDDLNCNGIREYEVITGSNRPEVREPGSSGFPYTQSRGGCHVLNGDLDFADVLDGTSNTMSIGEYSDSRPGERLNPYGSHGGDTRSYSMGYNMIWYSAATYNWAGITISFPPNSEAYYGSPVWSTINEGALHSAHPGGVNVTLADGSVRFISETIDLQTYLDLADRDEGNVLGEF